MKTWRKQYHLPWSNWKLSSFCSCWLTNHTNYVPSSKMRMHFVKWLLPFMIVYVTHYLKSFTFALQVIKNKVLTLNSNVRDSSSNRCLFFQCFTILNQRIKFWNKFRYCHLNIKLVRIGVCFRWLFKIINHFRSIFVVLCGVKDNFLLFFFLLLLLIFGFLFLLFLSLFSSKSFLFLKSFLLIFA